MLALTVLGLLSAATALLVIESERIDRRADRNIAQEFAEVDRLAAEPGTRRLRSAEGVLRQILERNVPQEHEVYLGVLEGEVRLVSYGPGGTVSGELAEDQAFVDAVNAMAEGGYASIETERGEIRFGVRPVVQDDVRGAYVVAQYTDPWRGEFVSVMQGFAVVAALTVLIVALGGWLASGRILAPVRELEATAREITESALDTRIAVTGPDTDVARLAHTFNAMLDRISDAFGSQRRFLDDAGHELGTPITILRGHLELLDARDTGEVEETRSLLLDELDRMERLTRDLVTLAKSERPDFVRRTACDLGDLTDDLLSLASGLGDRAWRLDARADVPADLDGQRITQAVLQLASNAVRYTRPGDEIGIGSAVTDGHALLWVRDTGPGVGPEERSQIFERFSRGAAGRGTEGSGLGLAIVKAIADGHKGEVLLDSEPGRGATFTLRLPVTGTGSAAEMFSSATEQLPVVP